MQNKSIYRDESTSQVSPPLALNAKQAAKAFGISEKTLWSYSKPRGPIPCVRVGKRVVYSVSALQAFLEQQSESEVRT